MDSFKGSVGSGSAGEAVGRGVLKACPQVDLQIFSIADGGEGFLEALVDSTHGRERLNLASNCTVNAVGQPMIARYLWEQNRQIAYVESAETLGYNQKVKKGNIEKNDTSGFVMRGSSAGVGVQIKQLLDQDAKTIKVGLGGTGTTDGGVGFLIALGARIWDKRGHQISVSPCRNPLLDCPTQIELADNAAKIASCDKTVRIRGLVDVNNQLTGKQGAARMFGPQKGASGKQVAQLEAAMKLWGETLNELTSGATVTPGAGAAGGMGAAIVALGGELVNGFTEIAQTVGLRQALKNADLVITGEGGLNSQTWLGKGPGALAQLAKAAGAKKVVTLVGSDQTGNMGNSSTVFDSVEVIHPKGRSLEIAMGVELTLQELERCAMKMIDKSLCV